MQTKRSKPVHINGNGTWQSKYGMMYKFEVEMENGDIGEYSSKDQNQTKFQIGVEVEYTIEGKDYNGKTYYNIKPVLQSFNTAGFGNSPNPTRDIRIIRQSSLKAMVDLCCADRAEFSWETIEKFVKYSLDGVIPSGDTLK